MKLPHTLANSLGFNFNDPTEICDALGKESEAYIAEIHRLFEQKLPPVVSSDSLAVMLGYNPGFIYSMLVNPRRHYRVFELPNSKKIRIITAPKVGVKIIQKWLSIHFENKWVHNDNVFGFVKGKSHLDAAAKHLGATWVASVDIENFFPSVNAFQVANALTALGYREAEGIGIITKIACKNGRLVQGSPCSPVLSNIVLRDLDFDINDFVKTNGLVYTRYADDIVVSGKKNTELNIVDVLTKIVQKHGWNVSERKSSFDVKPNRLKVHGLLVDGKELRLTKGYRNKMRAYKHLMNNNQVETNYNNIRGHLNYAELIRRYNVEE